MVAGIPCCSLFHELLGKPDLDIVWLLQQLYPNKLFNCVIQASTLVRQAMDFKQAP